MKKWMKKIHKWPWTKIGGLVTPLGTFIALIALIWSWNQTQKMTRPYIGISDNEDVVVTLDYTDTLPDGKRVDPAYKIPITIKNYGDLTAHFTVSYDSGFESEVRPCQVSTNFLLPGQSTSLCWYEHNISVIGDICAAFESKKITVSYGEIGGKRSYSTLIKTKKVKLPSESEQAKSQFSQFCTSPEGKIKYIYDWYVDQMY